MSIYSNQPEVQLTLPEHAPDASRPMIRPVPVPLNAGATYTAGLDADGRPTSREAFQVNVRVTPRGHWWRTDAAGGVPCLGCGHSFYPDLDDTRCSRPATAQDIASALLGRSAVAA